MKLLEVSFDGKQYGWVVGRNGCTEITVKANKATVICENEEIGTYQIKIDLTKFPMYTIG